MTIEKLIMKKEIKLPTVQKFSNIAATAARQIRVVFKSYAPFTKCITMEEK